MKLFIIFLFSGFVLLIASLVTLSMRQKDIHLVSKEYYKEELAYQATIDAVGRTPKHWIATSTSAGAATIYLSPDISAAMVEGTPVKIMLQRPQDAGHDRDTTLYFRDVDHWACHLAGLKPGRYQVRISWEHQGQQHLWQGAIYQ